MVLVGLRTLIVSFLLVGLCIFSFLSFANQFQVDMGANQTILNTTESNLNNSYGDLKTELSGAEQTARDSRDDFEGGKVETEETVDLNIFSIIGVGKRYAGVLVSFKNIIFDTVKTTFGFDENSPDGSSSFTVIIGTLSGILLVIIVFSAWRAYKIGS